MTTTAARECSIPGCARPHLARGFCRAHYLRWRRTGDPRAEAPVAVRGQAGNRRSSLRRVRAERGPATGHTCKSCGARAWCWSGPADADPAAFVPSCRSCLRRSTAAVSVDVERAARLYRAGVTARGIAAVLGVGSGAVLRALRAHGVPLRPGGRQPRRTTRTRPDTGTAAANDLDVPDKPHRPRRPSPRPREPTAATTNDRGDADDHVESHGSTTQRPKSDNQTIASRSDGGCREP